VNFLPSEAWLFRRNYESFILHFSVNEPSNAHMTSGYRFTVPRWSGSGVTTFGFALTRRYCVFAHYGVVFDVGSDGLVSSGRWNCVQDDVSAPCQSGVDTCP
jgi:hypothetical protein